MNHNYDHQVQPHRHRAPSKAMQFLWLGTVCTAAAILPGCAHSVVPQPSAITLENAMASVGKGLVALQKSEGSLRTGLVPSEATVTFNISASGTDSGKLYVELSPVSTSPVQGKAGGEASSSYTATRGNQVTITFRNLLLADPKVISENSKKFKQYKKDIENGGGTVFAPHPPTE